MDLSRFRSSLLRARPAITETKCGSDTLLQFKRDAVRIAQTIGLTLRQVAFNLGSGNRSLPIGLGYCPKRQRWPHSSLSYLERTIVCTQATKSSDLSWVRKRSGGWFPGEWMEELRNTGNVLGGPHAVKFQ